MHRGSTSQAGGCTKGKTESEIVMIASPNISSLVNLMNSADVSLIVGSYGAFTASQISSKASGNSVTFSSGYTSIYSGLSEDPDATPLYSSGINIEIYFVSN